jgi:uncharacterized repeat protein (TIGR01451 family)
MASPHSAGAVALLWSCNPALVGQIDATFQILQNNTDTALAGSCSAPPDGQGNYTFGYGYLNVLKAGEASCGVDLSITKTDNQTNALPGDTSTYTIVVANTSSSEVSGVTVADTFPTTLTEVTWTCTPGSGSSCASSGTGNINDTITLAANGSVTYIASATISPSATGVIQNTATVTPPEEVTDPNMANNTVTDNTLIRSGWSLCGNDNSLVACYQLDEDSGNVYLDGIPNPYNDGITINHPGWVTGVYNKALDFNGANQYGYSPDENSLDLTTSVTLAAWIK